MIAIRSETAADFDAREAVLDRCFGAARFLKTSERLREDRLPAEGLSFIAARDGAVMGTVRLWNITAGPGSPALLLGPLAVDEAVRGEGVGGRLMREALMAARQRGHRAVLLVGDAAYYARFGFEGRFTERLWLPGPVDRARFLGLELEAGALADASGMVSPTGRLEPTPDLNLLIAAMNDNRRIALAA
jgi:predicted N-acetyltransferase YhbS